MSYAGDDSWNGGGTPITDATAIPSDVVNGKVFYNNNGRQIGTLTGGIKTATIKVPSGPEESNSYYTPYYIDVSSGGLIKEYDYDIDGSSSPFYTLNLPNNLISLKIDSTVLYSVSMLRSLSSKSLHIFSNGYNVPGIHLRMQGTTVSFFALYPSFGYGDSDWAGKRLTLTYY